jgi:hypothetical protein
MGAGRERSRSTLESRSFGQLAQDGPPTSAPSRLGHLDEVVLEWVEGPGLDRLLVDTVRQTFLRHKRE